LADDEHRDDDAGNGDDEQHDDEHDDEAPATLEAALEALTASQKAHAHVQRESAQRRRKIAELERELATVREQGMSESERAVEAARREEREKVERVAAERIVRADVRAAAANRLRDPTDALAHLDVGELADLDDDEREVAIARELDRLLEAKPYLGRDGNGDEESTRGVPAGSQGARDRAARGRTREAPDSSDWLRKAARQGRRR
jgi:hypothetical protein